MFSLASVTTFKMVLSSKEAKVAYIHIRDNVLGRSDGTALKTSLDEEGIDDIFGISNIHDTAIDSLSCFSNYAGKPSFGR
jgi:hypothetical protein